MFAAQCMYVSADMNDFNLNLNARQLSFGREPVLEPVGTVYPQQKQIYRRTSHRTKPRALHDFEEAAVVTLL